MALTRLTLESANTALRTLVGDSEFLLDPPYQRGLVWGTERKRRLIRSLLMGIPVGTIIVNDRQKHYDAFLSAGHSLDEAYAMSVIDGKQRITAVRDFYDNCFAIPAHWLDAAYIADAACDYEEITYAEMTPLGQRVFKMLPISITTASVDSVTAEAEIFDLINFGGVAQDDVDD